MARQRVLPERGNIPELQAYLASKTLARGQHLIWTGAIAPEGRSPEMYFTGEQVRQSVRRVVWGLHHGQEPDDACVITPACGESLCINPDHLLAVPLRGSGQWVPEHTHKLTARDVRAIRALYQSGDWIQADLADLFGVSSRTIFNILSRQTWTHIE